MINLSKSVCWTIGRGKSVFAEKTGNSKLPKMAGILAQMKKILKRRPMISRKNATRCFIYPTLLICLFFSIESKFWLFIWLRFVISGIFCNSGRYLHHFDGIPSFPLYDSEHNQELCSCILTNFNSNKA